MEDLLPRLAIAIHHQPIPVLVNLCIPSQLLRNEQYVAQHIPVLPLQVVKGSNVLARDEQDVRWGLRVDITKSEELLVLEHLGCGNIPVSNFTKYAVVQPYHPFLITAGVFSRNRI